MTESFDPPIEWVAGSRWGLVWVIGSILAIYILTALFFLALAGWIMQGLPRFLTGLPELGCLVIGVNLYATLSRPMNLRIGLTPVALVVRGPLHTTAFPWQNALPHFRQRVPYGVAWNIGNWENCTYFRSSEAGSRLLAGGNSLRRSVLGISRMVLFDVRFRFPGARAHNSTIRGSLDVGPTIQWLGRGPSGSAAPLGLRT